jgi:hypothetical protein
MIQQISISQALAAPFPTTIVKYKPLTVKNNRALALAYIDCRAVQDRLDEVVGVAGWMDDYQILDDGSVVCHLKVWLGDQWISKSDVGSPSEQPDGGDRLKAAFSDALKRAAVKFGIGRYLYRLPNVWCDYDPVRKQIVPPGKTTAPKKTETAKPIVPTTGPELLERLNRHEAKLTEEARCDRGALIRAVSEAGEEAGYGPDIRQWPTPAVALGTQAAKSFLSRLPASRNLA